MAQSCPALCDRTNGSMPGFPVLYYHPGFVQTQVHWVAGATWPSHPLPPSSPVLNLSQHQALSQWVDSSHQVAKVLELHFSISPSNEYSRLISFRMDWLALLALQGTLKTLLQHHNLKASILQHSAFFMVQLSQLYMTNGKTIALAIRTFVGKVMSLLFNMLSRFVIAFLPRRKHHLTSCVQSLSTVTLEPKKIRSVTVSTFLPSICHEIWDWISWS